MIERKQEHMKLEIVKNNKTEYVIVHGEKAAQSEKTAAKELQRYLKMISGVEIPLMTDVTLPALKEIIVGKTNREKDGQFERAKWGTDGFHIQTMGEKLWLVGGEERGTLYSVYSFLEEYLGCRFYTEEIEKIPQIESISVSEIKKNQQIPVFIFRDAGWRDYIDTNISVKQKVNFNTWDRELPEHMGGGISYTKGAGGHTFSLLISPEEYFDVHPEYFSMDKEGIRVRDKQLCLTNPEVLELAIKKVREWLAEDPKAQIISISQNDAQGACLCDKCKKVYEEEGGSFSGTLIRFVNAIAENIAKDYPNVWVDTYAYSYTRSAPTKTKPANNVMIRLCTMGCCFSHPHDSNCTTYSADTYLDGGSNTFAEDFYAWSKICKHIFMYDYHCNYLHWLMTFPDFHNLSHNFAMYANNHVMGVMAQGNHQSKSAEFGELRSYLLSKLLWNPHMSETEFYIHMDDFLEGVYGPGGQYIHQYINLAEDLTKDICYGLVAGPFDLYPVTEVVRHKDEELPDDLTPSMLRNYSDTDWKKYWNWYTDIKESRITTEGEVLFKKAIELAETELQCKQLDKIYCQVEYIKSYFYKKKIDMGSEDLKKMLSQYIQKQESYFSFQEMQELPLTIAAYAKKQIEAQYSEYNRKLAEKIVGHGITYMFEGMPFDDWENFKFYKQPVEWGLPDDNFLNKVNAS